LAIVVLSFAAFTAPADVSKIVLPASKTSFAIPNFPSDAPDLNLDAFETYSDAAKSASGTSNIPFFASKPVSDISELPSDAPKPAFDVPKTLSDASKMTFYASKTCFDAPDSTTTDWQRAIYD
jgi:hypothetical protein